MTATTSHESELQEEIEESFAELQEEIEESLVADHNYTNSMSSTGRVRNETPYKRKSAGRMSKSRQIKQNRLTEVSEESLEILRDIRDSVQNISKSLETIASAVHHFKST